MKDIPEDLIKSAVSGDAAAFERIYWLSSGFVYSVALRVLGNTADAEEVTQEVFIRAYRSLEGFAFRSSFKTWLYRITMNLTINAYNKRSRHDRRRADYDEDLAGASCGSPAPNDASATSGETEKTLRYLLDKLTPDHRAVIVLRELEGLSYEDISKALNVNINTVRTRLKRAREALMEYGRKGVISHAV